MCCECPQLPLLTAPSKRLSTPKPFEDCYCTRYGLLWWLCCCCCCQVASVVSDSVRPHRRQPTRLPRPWDSPGKNTGVGCHCLPQCMKMKSESEVAQSCLLATPWTAAHQAPPSMGVSRQEYWSGAPLPSLLWWLRWSRICLQCRKPWFDPWVRKIP